MRSSRYTVPTDPIRASVGPYTKPRYEYQVFEIESGMFGASSVPKDELNALVLQRER